MARIEMHLDRYPWWRSEAPNAVLGDARWHGVSIDSDPTGLYVDADHAQALLEALASEARCSPEELGIVFEER